MKKLFLILSIVLTACATNSVDPNIPTNVTLSTAEAYNAKYIESVRFDLEAKYLGGNPAKCLALNVDNKEYTLTDSSNSFVGAYTGSYYNIEKHRQVGGGQSLIYSDETSAISKGSTEGKFTFGLVPIIKIVTFKVDVNTAESKRSITFTDIRAAQQSTGAASNDGFNRVGAWSGAKPVFVYDLLNQVSNDIKSCLSGS